MRSKEPYVGPALEYVDRAVAWAEENSEKIGHVPRAFPCFFKRKTVLCVVIEIITSHTPFNHPSCPVVTDGRVSRMSHANRATCDIEFSNLSLIKRC